MATCTITGTIQDATGAGVENVVVRLTGQAATADYGEARAGVAVIADRPSEVLTDDDGEFTITAVRGFRYLLEIPAVALKRTFVCPELPTVRFDLLGLAPRLTDTKDYEDGEGADLVDATVEVYPEETVRERFDSLVIERATALDGAYVEVDTLDLEPGRRFYTVTDEDGGASYFYRARYMDTGSGDVSSYSDARRGDSFREALVLSVQEFLDTYLFGIDLTDEQDRPYPAIMFERAIKAATQWVEKALDCTITPIDVVEELHDHVAADYGRWGWLSLFRYPVIRLDEVKFQYPSMGEGVVISPEWAILQDGGAHGLVQIVPGQGNIADVLLIPGALLPLWSGAQGWVPAVWRVSYRAGFEVADCPEDVRHVIGMIASLAIMNVAGDLVGGSGLQSWSVGVPGLNQNITTTNSSTNAGFGARVLEYMKEIKWMLPVLQAAYGKSSKLTVA